MNKYCFVYSAECLSHLEFRGMVKVLWSVSVIGLMPSITVIRLSHPIHSFTWFWFDCVPE